MSLLQRLSPRRDTPVTVRVVLGMLLVAVLVVFGHTCLRLGGPSTNDLFDDWIYDAVTVGCAAVCLARGLSDKGARMAWLFLGFGLACDAAGEILASISESLAPTIQDVLYVCLYLGAYVATVLLARLRMSSFRASMWLDGIAGMLAIGSLGAVAVSAPVQPHQDASLRVVLNIAYPMLDVMLVGIVIAVLTLSGWRAARPFAMIAVGFLIMAVADGVYFYQQAHGTYTPNTPLDSLWLLSAVVLAYAAWQPDGTPAPARDSPHAIMAAPILSGLTAIGVLVYANLEEVSGLSVWFAVATLVAVLLRLVVTSGENIRLIASTSALANRDTLTGLDNRRALLDDLQRAAAEATAQRPKLVLVFDLNGFKRYNDTFGHPAGDVLLKRLARKLDEQVRTHGRAYRLGGDEFCAVLDATDDPALFAAEIATSLLESGEHFTIGASYGEVLLGIETRDVEEALRIADQRLYAHKTSTHRHSRPEWRDVLLGLQRERDPQLQTHARQVADLALRVGQRLAMSTHELRNLVAAAELHDIGKAAIPDAILDKPAALDDQERAFIERHTLIGERILASAPTGRPVASIVRATHEHYDGRGYPDGLSGQQIPLAARIIAICDAYHAMTSDRSYRDAMSQRQALQELRCCAGSQFDPQITAIFLELVEEGPHPAPVRRRVQAPAL